MDLPVQNKVWMTSDLDFFEYGERKAVVLRKLEGEEVSKKPNTGGPSWLTNT